MEPPVHGKFKFGGQIEFLIEPSLLASDVRRRVRACHLFPVLFPTLREFISSFPSIFKLSNLGHTGASCRFGRDYTLLECLDHTRFF
jgi:hypothetical protein